MASLAERVGPVSVIGVQVYQYDTLTHTDSFRLLELLPGEEGDPLCCRILMNRLQNAPMYKAISYCWGSTENPTMIHVSGKQFTVSRNLADCLRRIRSRTQASVLWADQICIDQADVKERGHQVGIMAIIYKNAELVYVYLGPDPEGIAKAAIHAVHQLSQLVEKRILKYGYVGRVPDVLSHQLSEYDIYDWRAIRQMLQCSWFQRTWVLQEVGLARRATILFGSETLPWTKLIMLCGWLLTPGFRLQKKWGLDPVNHYSFWESFDPARIDKGMQYSFLEILARIRDFNTSDPRDKIYSLLGHPILTNQGFHTQIVPQYQWAVEKVYLDFAYKWLRQSGRPTLLDYSFSNNRATFEASLKFPSWCPRWDELGTDVDPLNADNGNCWYQSTLSTKFSFEKVGESALQLIGFEFDVIEEAYPQFLLTNIGLPNSDGEGEQPNLSNSRPETALGIFVEVLERAKTKHLIHANVLQAVAITATAGYDHKWTSAAEDNRRSHINQFLSFCRYQAMLDPNLPLHNFPAFSKPTLRRKMADYYESGLYMATERRLCITKRGYLCLAGPHVQVGDLVCLVFGSSTPYVLSQEHDGTYLFHGDCYVHDVMRGEAMEMFNKGEFTAQTFVLR